MATTVWKGYVSFGLVSFPVRLYSAARGENVRFHLLHKKDLSRVKEVLFCASEDKRIERADTIRGFETKKGKYVTVEDAELKGIAPTTATTMEIVQFVAADEVDPILFQTSYYVGAEKGGAKPFALFLAALEGADVSAIAKVAMHNREHLVLLRPSEGGLVLHTLFYADEMHKDHKAEAPSAKYTSQEMELAKTLIKHLTAPFKHESFHDAYRENVARLIKEKDKGKEITVVEQPRPEKVIDLMEALKRSLEAGKKTKKTRKAAA